MVAVAPCVSWSPFRDTLKVLEAGIQYANTLTSECSRDHDKVCLQMRMSYSPDVRIFLFLMQWTNCSLADAVGLLRILLFMWTTPPPCAPTKGRPASRSYMLFREHYMSHEFKITYLEKMPKEDWWDYGLVSGALLGLSMMTKHGCKKFLLKIGLEKIPKEDWWDYIRFGDRSFTRPEYDEQAWMQETSPENRTLCWYGYPTYIQDKRLR